MDEKLKSCPFCGKSVAEIDDAKELGGCPYYDDCDQAEYEQCEMHSVVCNVHRGGCGASSGYFFTAEEAISAWNRRAERTCRYVGDEISGGCSECRGWLDPACSYCPSCGARVVSE